MALSEYTQLEYIYNNDDWAYIDTGYTMEKTDSITFEQICYISDKTWSGVNGYCQWNSEILTLNTKCTVKVEYDGSTFTQKIYVNNVLNTTNSWSEYNVTNSKIGVLRMGSDNNSWWSSQQQLDGGYVQAGRLYSYKMYKNNTLVSDLIPVKRKSDNVVGMYNKVDNKFLSSAGSDPFYAGPIKDNIINYQKLEYIQTTGTQYIDTGIKCKSSLKFQTKFSTTNLSGGTFFGNKGSGERNAFRFFATNSSNRWYLDFGSGENLNRIYGGSAAINTLYEVEIGNRYIKDVITGNNIISSSSVTFSDKTYNFFISNSNESLTIYYCKIWDSDNLVRDFVPVKRKSDNVIGMFDKISNTFFGNAGTGNFIAGPVVFDGSQLQQNILEIQDLMIQCNDLSLDILGGTPKPDPLKDYKKLEYIQSTGSQYINTDINIGATTDIEVKFITVQAADGYGRVWGSTSDMKYELADTGGNTGYRISINGTGYSFSTANDIKIVKMTGNGVVFLNNSQIYNFEKSYTGGEKLWLFWGNSGDWKNVYSRIKLYYAKVWQDNKLVRNYMPVLRKEDNKVGLFDIQNNQFYIDVNNGNFTAGPEKN